MTNKEKYIESMTDKELALFLSCGSQIIDNYIDINPSLTDDEEIRKQAARNCDEIEKWLSQEAEEDKEHSNSEPCGIDKNHTQVDSMEEEKQSRWTCGRWNKCSKCPKCPTDINVLHNVCRSDYIKEKTIELTEKAYKELLSRIDKLEMRYAMDNKENICPIGKSADEMFEKLGYKRCGGTSWKWKKLSDKDYYMTYIWIYKNKFGKWDENASGERTYCLITEDEYKAIHKKI